MVVLFYIPTKKWISFSFGTLKMSLHCIFICMASGMRSDIFLPLFLPKQFDSFYCLSLIFSLCPLYFKFQWALPKFSTYSFSVVLLNTTVIVNTSCSLRILGILFGVCHKFAMFLNVISSSISSSHFPLSSSPSEVTVGFMLKYVILISFHRSQSLCLIFFPHIFPFAFCSPLPLPRWVGKKYY